MKRLLRRATVGLHRDSGGQSMAFVALTAFLVLCFVIILLNQGRHLTHKVVAQNAVDAAVVSSATYQARGMNLIAMTNIMQSMLLAEAIFIEAIPWAVAESAAVAAANASCYCDPWCDLDFGRCWQSIKEEWNCIMVGIQLLSNGFPPLADQIEYVFDQIEMLSDVAAGVQEGFQIQAMQEANIIAEFNGLDYGFVYPNEMPIEEGELEDLCDTMTDGDNGGYEKWWNAGVVAAMLMLTITEYQSNAFGPAFAAYPHWADGPLGSPTQQLPFQALFGEMAPLALGNTWWEQWVAIYWWVECGGGLMWPSLDSYVDTGVAKPLILDSDYPDSGQYVGFGYDDPEDGAPTYMPDHFKNGYNDLFGMITVAQAEVINTHEANMFVPRWHARMVPVSKLGDTPLDIGVYMLSTDGVPWPPLGALARIQGWRLLLGDLTQEVITH
jgi:hypothetical protein